MNVLMYIICVLYFLLFLLFLLLSKKPFKYLFLNAICGLWCFLVLNLLSFVTNMHIPVNWNNIAVSSLLGAPGTILLVLLKYCIFI